MTNKYELGNELVKSSISGDRLHHTFRYLEKATETYDYELSFGENFHTLAVEVFGDQTDYWVLQDINPPKDAFGLVSGNVIKLPIDIVRNPLGTKKFFQ